jgi:urease accessory protein
MIVQELSHAPSSRWRGRLELRLERRGERSVIAHRRHEGPLMVQRAFHPERDGTCHLYVLHPPGGVVGGDRLELDVELMPGAQALITTPAATKLYRSEGAVATLVQNFRVHAGAVFEWLPQETIAFGGAHAESLTRVELEPGATYLGWEITCLGRPASGDRFERGALDQRTEIWQGKRPLLLDRLLTEAGAPTQSAAFGWGGRSVYGCLLYTGSTTELTRELRAEIAPTEPGDVFAVTQLGGIGVCRALGTSGQRVRRYLERAWGIARRHLLRKSESPPRIWAT